MSLPFIQLIIAFVIGVLLVFYAIPIIVRISIAKHLYDVPNERKVNKTVIPNLGGVAIFMGISMGTLLGMLKSSFPDWRYILSAMLILFFIGIKDDILIISARKKFAAQVMSALILILLGDIRFTNFHGILGLNEINYAVSVLVSLIAIVGTINALNLIDGIDGLAAAIGMLASFIFGILFFQFDQINYAVVCAATFGSLMSFFVYNVFGKTNKIFMGDTGSLIVGLILAASAIYFNESTIYGNADIIRMSPILTLAILAVPLFDMVRLFVVRILSAKSPFAPDMNHIHHKFLKLGFSHLKSTIIILLSNLFIVAVIYLLRAESNHLLLLILLILVSALMLVPGVILRYRESSQSRKTSKFEYYYNPSRVMNPEPVKTFLHLEKPEEEEEIFHKKVANE